MADDVRKIRVVGLDKLPAALDAATEMFKHMGDAADAVGRTADNIASATDSPELRRAQRSLRSWGAFSFAALLDQLFGRTRER